MDVSIKKLEKSADIDSALALAEEVFSEFEAPLYGSGGTESFRGFLYGERMESMREKGSVIFFGAYYGDELAGMCAVRDKSHIALMFVKGKHHRKGIGRKLFFNACETVNSLYGTRILTLNSSPCGLPFYSSLGFMPTDMERMEDGIIYTPMIYSYKKENCSMC